MRCIITGAIAFILFYMFDYCNLKNYKALKTLSGTGGILLFLYSLVMTALSSETIFIPLPIKLMSFVLCFLFGFLLIYSLFLELPFYKTYRNKIYNSTLIDTGTYALSRHPGVLWLFLFLINFYLATGLKEILPAGLIWTSLDVFYVYLQEKFIFNKMFPEYDEYSESTPMLIPNLGSIRKSVDTLFLRRG